MSAPLHPLPALRIPSLPLAMLAGEQLSFEEWLNSTELCSPVEFRASQESERLLLATGNKSVASVVADHYRAALGLYTWRVTGAMRELVLMGRSHGPLSAGPRSTASSTWAGR